MSHLVGIETYTEYIHKDILFIHGHQFTIFKDYNKIVKKLLNTYVLFQKILPKKLILFIEHWESKILNSRNLVKNGAHKFAKHKNVKSIICGHTHYADEVIFEDVITYFNTGCWVDDKKMTYITIKDDNIKLNQFKMEE